MEAMSQKVDNLIGKVDEIGTNESSVFNIQTNEFGSVKEKVDTVYDYLINIVVNINFLKKQILLVNKKVAHVVWLMSLEY
jgi:hypothetical protein